MVVDNMLRKYIGIGGVEPLVVEKIFSCSWSGVRRRWYLILLNFSGVRGESICEKLLTAESATVWNRGITCKILKSTHNCLIFYILSSFFGSISHHFKFHRVDILFIQGFDEIGGEVLCEKVSAIDSATSWNRVAPCKLF